MPPSESVMVIDDEPGMGRLLLIILEEAGYRVRVYQEPIKALADFTREPADIVLTDVRMPKVDGVGVLEAIKQRSMETPVVLMTAFGTLETAVNAMKKGASDYVAKPFKNEEIRLVLASVLEKRRLLDENRRLRVALAAWEGLDTLVGSSEPMKRLHEMIGQISQSDATALLLGESGTGKELAARAIHRSSPRADRPFQVIHCGALPETLLESELFGHVKGAFTDAHKDQPGLLAQAEGGTIFLDEVGEMPLPMQVKFLRFLQEREIRPLGGATVRRVDVRVIAATNKDLRKEVSDGRFREDLFYRLAVVPITLPPLRERKEDIPLLVDCFLNRIAKRSGASKRSFSPEAMAHLVTQLWPGNVRELENAVEHAVAVSRENILPLESLPNSTGITLPEPKAKSYRDAKRHLLDRFEQDYVTDLLNKTSGNVSRAAELADMDRKNFQDILKKHNITRPL